MIYQVNTETLSIEEFTEKFQELSLRYEEDNYTECGFEQATKQKERLLKAIRSGQLTQKDYDEMHPVFVYANSDLNTFVTPQEKRPGLLERLFSR
ncbi:hypothetical protein [Marinimicrobium sp. ABcell2]|uniref:hypothetical protein n=1 Tax=Marinimicrobium sp. ABcell2 TaxID=3069751 RepID=UPI0027B8752A|nr:hypothetical protein [Marinimicrobium sp. ABcell2]MDQ2077093.1 hypothetical protein [Marinimicrobium sp. ABcell2]